MRVPGSLATDVRSLDTLKNGAAKDPSSAIKQAASQFEALFMQMVLKSMRDAVPKSGMLEGTGSDVFTSMLDSQFAQAMSGRPAGLSDLIARQLSRGTKTDDPAAPSPQADTKADAKADAKATIDGLARALLAQDSLRRHEYDPQRQVDDSLRREGDEPSLLPSGAHRAAAAAAQARAAVADTPRGAAQSAFVGRTWNAALAAERATGVPAGFIVGQAALETGWGRQEIRHADGRSAHNLFGIKAGPGWRGETVDATTTEYVDGRAVKTVERFRAYGSHEDAFADWAKLMASNPRYAGVLQAGGSIEAFSRSLQQAGYATDPDYASKLTRTITQALTLRRAST